MRSKDMKRTEKYTTKGKESHKNAKPQKITKKENEIKVEKAE